MRKLKTILILCLLSCTALSQNDSTFCFTKSQVKTFLTTKVELQNCIEVSNVIRLEMDTLQSINSILTVDNTKTKRKLRRTRVIASVGILSTILVLLILVL